MNRRLHFIKQFALVLSLVLFSAISVQAKLSAKNIKVVSIDSEGHALNHPTTLHYDSFYRETYLTDESKGQLVIYGADFFPKLSIGLGRGLSPVYGSFARDGLVYASVGHSEKDKPHILVLNRALLPIKKIFPAGFEGAEDFIPRKIAVARDGTIYVTGLHPSYVFVLSAEGKYLRTIVPKTDSLGILEKATIVSLTIGGDGRLYFLSEELGKVFVYSAKEKYLYSFGEKGGVSGKLARPKGLALDERNGRVYIADYLRHTVSVFSFQGKFLFEFGGKGLSRGWFQYPTDVSVDHRGDITVSDTFNDRIQVFRVDQVLDEFNIAESSEDNEDNEDNETGGFRAEDSGAETFQGQLDESGTQSKDVKTPVTGGWGEGPEGEDVADF